LSIRFSKRITIFPGLRINLGKRGISTTIGPRCLSLGIGRKGIFSNLGIRGTALSQKLLQTRKTKTLGEFRPPIHRTVQRLIGFLIEYAVLFGACGATQFQPVLHLQSGMP
jgi:hypothetical protein